MSFANKRAIIAKELTVFLSAVGSSLGQSTDQRLDRSGEKNVSLYRVSLDSRGVLDECHHQWGHYS